MAKPPLTPAQGRRLAQLAHRWVNAHGFYEFGLAAQASDARMRALIQTEENAERAFTAYLSSLVITPSGKARKGGK